MLPGQRLRPARRAVGTPRRARKRRGTHVRDRPVGLISSSLRECFAMTPDPEECNRVAWCRSRDRSRRRVRRFRTCSLATGSSVEATESTAPARCHPDGLVRGADRGCGLYAELHRRDSRPRRERHRRRDLNGRDLADDLRDEAATTVALGCASVRGYTLRSRAAQRSKTSEEVTGEAARTERGLVGRQAPIERRVRQTVWSARRLARKLSRVAVGIGPAAEPLLRTPEDP
jgi:hypothetical protein